MQRGFLYLVAIMDWATRRVLIWRLSNIMDAEFCVEALKEAIERYGKPEIFNTDQGSQFTSGDFTGALLDAEAKISMPLSDALHHLPVTDGKGRWIDNRFVERLWRSLKYECVYIHAYLTGTEARNGIGAWIDYYNTERPRSALDGRTPGEAHEGLPMQIKQAA